MRRRSQNAVLLGVGAVAAAVFAASPAIVGSDVVHAAAPLTTYGPELGEDATATVEVEYDAGGYTQVTMTVVGLPPLTSYTVRARVGGCAAERDGLGEVFQLSPNPDPEKPGDRRYRNRENEVWLDLQLDADGAGTAHTTQKWQFHPTWRPGSVTIHPMSTNPNPSAPVEPALACLEVAF